MFELRIAEAIEEEAKLSQEHLRTGFLHAFKAGELIEEVKSLLNSEEELGRWLESNCSNTEQSNLNNCRRLFRGETVKVEAHKAETKEPQRRKR